MYVYAMLIGGALLGLAGVSHWSLTTTDAHELYAKFGFVREGRYMRLTKGRPDLA